jgi:hypothetical protein
MEMSRARLHFRQDKEPYCSRMPDTSHHDGTGVDRRPGEVLQGRGVPVESTVRETSKTVAQPG